MPHTVLYCYNSLQPFTNIQPFTIFLWPAIIYILMPVSLHYSATLTRRLSFQELNSSRLDFWRHLASDIAVIFEWCHFMSPNNFLHLSTAPNRRLLFILQKHTHLPPSAVSIIDLSLTLSILEASHLFYYSIIFLRLGILCHLQQFFPLSQMGIVSLPWWGAIHSALMNRVISRAFLFISSLSVPDCLLTLKSYCIVTSLSIFCH